jgi:hypothetical protein
MNERIKQLAEQARQYAWVNETHWSANAEREALFEEKFAELIVAECISTLDQDDGATHHGELLREHFGVESA